MAVLVYTENWKGKFKKITYELLSYANEIAKNINQELYALSIGNVEKSELEELAKYGAKKIYNISEEKFYKFESQPYSAAIAEVASKIDAKVILFSNNYTGRSLSPRLSVKLKAGLASGVLALPSSYEPFTVKKGVYGGKAFSNVEISTDIKLLTLSQNTFEITENKVDVEFIDYAPNIHDNYFKTIHKELNIIEGKMPLTDAEIIVSAGRGLKGPENWGMIEELAELLGAGVACSRPVADSEWRPHEEHVGQTGKVVRPNLYIAIGISGAIQHLAGVNGSKVMVAINNDPDAPFFEAADYGIIGDAFKVVPKIIESVKKLKSE